MVQNCHSEQQCVFQTSKQKVSSVSPPCGEIKFHILKEKKYGQVLDIQYSGFEFKISNQAFFEKVVPRHQGHCAYIVQELKKQTVFLTKDHRTLH